MPLDDLVSVIETLQQRIRRHASALQSNETQTRTALIDPLLTALGWDVSDPALVTPEYRVDVGWADYALRGTGNQRAAIIEAKRLGSIVENHLGQMVNYCIQEGIAYAGVTDGSHWQLYRTFDPVPMSDKIVLDVNIADTPAYECALKLLLLWRPNVSSGKAIPAESPIATPTVASTPFAAEQNQVSSAPPVVAAPGDGWCTLSAFVANTGDPSPTALRFSDGDEQPLTSWRQIVQHTVAWLWSQGRLNEQSLPLQSSKIRHIFNSVPIHPNGKSFHTKVAVPGTPLVIEANISSKAAVSNTKKLLNHCGVSPDTVQLQVEQ